MKLVYEISYNDNKDTNLTLNYAYFTFLDFWVKNVFLNKNSFISQNYRIESN